MEQIFEALADPTRRLMLDELAEHREQTLYELNVRLITRHHVTASRQAIAKHLAVLENAGLVSTVRRGKYKLITFNDEPLRHLGSRWLKT